MGKAVGKARLLVITLTVNVPGTRTAKWKRVQAVLKRIEEWHEVKFQQLAPGIYITEKRHSIQKLRTVAQILEEELPGVTVFLCKKPAPRTKDISELPYLPTEETVQRKKTEEVVEWVGRVREEHGVWYISVPKETREQLTKLYGVNKGSLVRVRFIARVS